jgi:solute carrier family 35 protein E4
MNEADVKVALTIAIWFILNITISNVTKWTYVYGKICVKEYFGCEQFRFPFMVTVVHMVFSWACCFIYLKYFRQSLKQGSQLDIAQQATKIAPLAACVAGSFGASNVALKYIYPSFNQMLGSMTPLITVCIAVSFQGKRYNTWTYGSIVFICGGLIVCGVKEVNFHVLGLSCAICATVLRAVKSIIQGQLLTEKMDAVTLLYYMAPWAAVFLFAMGVCVEGLKPILLLRYGLMQDEKAAQTVIMLLILGGLNACFLNITNFQVTADTSAVMLNVLGNVKNCIGIIVSVLIFGNPLLIEQVFGVIVCLVGVYFYQKYGSTVKPPPSPAPKNGGSVELPAIPELDSRRGTA